MSGQSLNNKEVARRYASAFSKALASDGVQQAYEQFLSFTKMLIDDENFGRLTASSLRNDHQLKIIKSVIDRSDLPQKVQNFLLLIAARGRVNILPEIYNAVKALHLQKSNKIEVKITVPREMTDKEMQDAVSQIKETFSAEPVLDVHIDPEILSGYVIRAGVMLIDNSLQTRLKNLYKSMKGVA
ncbi:MAG: ATP synthase F1 subunit delta [Pseudomonadota bacterium]